MPSATLTFPASYNVMAMGFKRGQSREVTIPQAVYLSTVENFEVDMGELTAQDIQKHMFEMEKNTVKPKDPDLILTHVRLAYAALDKDDKDNFNKDGRIDSRALSRVLGYTVTNTERDEALSHLIEIEEDSVRKIRPRLKVGRSKSTTPANPSEGSGVAI